MKTEKQRIAWWQRGLSFALSVAMVMASTPTAALAEALDEAGSEVALVETVDDEVVTDDESEGEGVEASGDGEAAVAEDEGVAEDETEAEGDEEVLPSGEDELAEGADEPAAPEAALGETVVSEDDAAAEEAEPAADDDIELTAQASTSMGNLATNGEWNTTSIAGSDAATFNDTGDYSVLEAHYWRVTMSSAGTLSVDIWAKNSALRWWISRYDEVNDKLVDVAGIDEKVIKAASSDTQSASVSAGTYYVFIVSNTAASGNYGVRAYTAKRALTRATFNGKTASNISTLTNKVYTAAAQKPAVTVKYGSTKLTKGIDYTIAYAANKKVGTASITIKGKGLYSGTKVIKFKIVKRSIKKTKVTIGIKPWTGKLVKPNPVVKIGKVKLKKGVDYTIVKYVNNKNVGTAKVVIKGKGGLKGTRVIKFKIRYNIGRNKAVKGEYTLGTTTFNRFIFVKTNATMKSGRDYRLSVVENSSSKKVYKMVGKGMYYGTTYFTFYK